MANDNIIFKAKSNEVVALYKGVMHDNPLPEGAVLSRNCKEFHFHWSGSMVVPTVILAVTPVLAFEMFNRKFNPEHLPGLVCQQVTKTTINLLRVREQRERIKLFSKPTKKTI